MSVQKRSSQPNSNMTFDYGQQQTQNFNSDQIGGMHLRISQDPDNRQRLVRSGLDQQQFSILTAATQ